MLDAELLNKYNHQAEMLANKVKKRYQHLYKRFARQNIEVFRLYDWDIPEIRAVVDWYGGHLVVGEYTRAQSTPEWLPIMGAAVCAALGVPPDNLHLKVRVYGKADGRRYERIDTTDRMFVVSERDLKFYVNPWDYVDTGLFGDHRDTRQMIRERVAGKDFLNLFCYTGTFSCYAAKGGARRTVSVDRSKSAIAWARRNLALNAIEAAPHRLIQMHAFEFLSTAKHRAERFDLALVDPPSFYTIQETEEHFDINTDHPVLLHGVAELMHPGATIFFSTNHQDFTPRMDALGFAEAKEITDSTIPEDYRHKRKSIHRCWKIIV
ncbi:MAG: class I SAM-dependent methyltransferase [Desulfatitalea sp.]